MVDKLEPCPNPWCEGEEGVAASQHVFTGKWHICCDDCMIDGPWADSHSAAIAAWNTRATPANGEQVERVAAIARDLIPSYEDRAGGYDKTLEVLRFAATLSTPTEDARSRVVPPENGEPDPAWASIKRAIDQFAGRVPKIGKHHALNNGHIAEVVKRLDATGDAEAADTIVWQCWWRALDRERERFLLSDAAEQRSAARSRVKVLEEALEGALVEHALFDKFTPAVVEPAWVSLARAALGNKETDRHG